MQLIDLDDPERKPIGFMSSEWTTGRVELADIGRQTPRARRPSIKTRRLRIS
jgi:hypothetical protein